MLRDLQNRLRKLEGNRPPQQSQGEKDAKALCGFITTAIGYYLGDPRPDEEAPITAYGRALGYTHKEVLDALRLEESEGNNPELSERYACARSKLFAKFGLNLDEANLGDDAAWHEFIEILKRMHAGMSEQYKNLANKYLSFD